MSGFKSAGGASGRCGLAYPLDKPLHVGYWRKLSCGSNRIDFDCH